MLITQHLQNEKGMAALEIIPIVIIVVLLLSFSFGFFGVIHTGILNSMAARNYAFETFNHRSDLRYSIAPLPGYFIERAIMFDPFFKEPFGHFLFPPRPGINSIPVFLSFCCRFQIGPFNYMSYYKALVLYR